MITKDRITLIISIVIIIAIIFVYLSMSGISGHEGTIPVEKHPVNNTPALVTNSSFKEFPPEIQDKIQIMSDMYSIPPGYWGFDSVNNEIDLVMHDVNSTAKDLRGKQIGNYSIYLFTDTELASTYPEASAHLLDLMKNPEYQISSFDMVTSGTIVNPTGPYVELHVYKTVPENEKLDNTMIKGWRILVYPLSNPLPTT